MGTSSCLAERLHVPLLPLEGRADDATHTHTHTHTQTQTMHRQSEDSVVSGIAP